MLLKDVCLWLVLMCGVVLRLMDLVCDAVNCIGGGRVVIGGGGVGVWCYRYCWC